MKIFLSEKKKKKKKRIFCVVREKRKEKKVTSWSSNAPLEILLLTRFQWHTTFGLAILYKVCFLCVQVRFQKENVRKRWNFWRIKLCFWAEINHCHCPVMIFQSANQIQFISWTIDGLRWTWTEINLSHFSYTFLAKMSAHSFPFHILWTTLCLDFHTLRLVIFHRWDMS